MGRKEKNLNISQEKLVEYQRQLSNFLKTYRAKRGLLAKDLATSLGYTPSRFGQLESETTPQSRFSSSLDFLHSISSLENMSLPEFIIYLEGDQNKLDQNGELKRPLHKWETDLLSIFDPIDRMTREDFISKAKNINQDKMEAISKINVLLANLSDDNIKKFEALLESLTS